MNKKESSTQTTKVHICNSCEGHGVSYESGLSDYHRGEYTHWTEKCRTCGGTGLLKTTTQIITTTEPFTPVKPD